MPTMMRTMIITIVKRGPAHFCSLSFTARFGFSVGGAAVVVSVVDVAGMVVAVVVASGNRLSRCDSGWQPALSIPPPRAKQNPPGQFVPSGSIAVGVHTLLAHTPQTQALTSHLLSAGTPVQETALPGAAVAGAAVVIGGSVGGSVGQGPGATRQEPLTQSELEMHWVESVGPGSHGVKSAKPEHDVAGLHSPLRHCPPSHAWPFGTRTEKHWLLLHFPVRHVPASVHTVSAGLPTQKSAPKLLSASASELSVKSSSRRTRLFRDKPFLSVAATLFVALFNRRSFGAAQIGATSTNAVTTKATNTRLRMEPLDIAKRVFFVRASNFRRCVLQERSITTCYTMRGGRGWLLPKIPENLKLNGVCVCAYVCVVHTSQMECRCF